MCNQSWQWELVKVAKIDFGCLMVCLIKRSNNRNEGYQTMGGILRLFMFERVCGLKYSVLLMSMKYIHIFKPNYLFQFFKS